MALGRVRVCALIFTRLGPGLPVLTGRHFTLGMFITSFQTLLASHQPQTSAGTGGEAVPVATVMNPQNLG